MLLLLFTLCSIHYNHAGRATFSKTPLSELMHESIHEIDSLLEDFQREIQKEKSVLRAVDLEIQDADLPDHSKTPVWWSPGTDHTGNHTPTTFFPYPAGYFTTTTKDPWESWSLPGLQYSSPDPTPYVPSPGHLPDFGYPLNHTPFNPLATFDGPTNVNYSAPFTRPSFPFTVPSRAEPTSPEPRMNHLRFVASYPSGYPTVKLPPRERLPRPGVMRSVSPRLEARTSSEFFAMSSVRNKVMRDRSWYRPRGRPTQTNRMTAPTGRRPQQRKRTLSKARAWVQNRQWMKTKKPGRTIQGHMREGKDDAPPEPKPIAVDDAPPSPEPVAVDKPPPEPKPIAVDDVPPGPEPVAVDKPPLEPKPIAVDDAPPGSKPVGEDDSLPKPTTTLITISVPGLTDILPSMSLPGLDELTLTTAVRVSVSPSTTRNPLTADFTTTQTAFTEELFQEDDAGFLFVTSPSTIYVPVTEMTTNTFGQVLHNAENFTVSTPGASPYQAYYELMESLDEGYLTVFLLELTRLVAQKPPAHAGEVLAHAEIIYNNLYEKGSVAFFGEEILELGMKVSRMFSGSDISVLQSHANMMNQMLRGRAQFLSVEVNSIIDYADMLFEDDEGEDLFQAVRMFEAYPNGGVSSYDVCLNLLESFIKPYRRLRSTGRLRKLIDSITKVAATRFGNRRSGDTATTTEPPKTIKNENHNARSLRRQIETKRQRIKRPRPERGDQDHRRQVYGAPPALRSMLPITKHQKRFRVMTPKQLRTNGYMNIVRPTVAYFRRRLGRPRHPENGVLQLFPQARDGKLRRRAQPADEEPDHFKEPAPQTTPGAMRDEVRRIIEESSYSDEEASLKLHLRQALRVNWHRTAAPAIRAAGAET